MQEDQKQNLIESFAERMVDDMDIDTVCTLALEYLKQSYSEYTIEQLKTEVEEYYPDLLEK